VPDTPLKAIIDIGSNSVRLVVYAPPARAPAVLFNEKVLAGLGSGLAATGMLDSPAMTRAIRALERYRRLAREMGVTDVRTVATAAVRDARNGPDFLAQARALGLDIELLSGEAEAEAAGLGVIAAIPDADGIVGDLGGGSLELVRVKNGVVGERLSLPLGVLRLTAIRTKRGSLDRVVTKALKKAGWPLSATNLPFYMVGGSWRALARLHMRLADYPLPVLHSYVMPSESPARLVRVLAQIDRKRLKAMDALPNMRIPVLADAAALLAILSKALQSSALVVSTFGLREGLLYGALPDDQRAVDPLIVATRQAAVRQARFDEHGDLLDRWIRPLFANENIRDARLRHAACLLGDVAWAANPEFRAERGVDVALHGNWVGIDARGRSLMAQALHVSFGASGSPPAVTALLTGEEITMATRWGLAMRLGQRFSGGVAGPLLGSHLEIANGNLRLITAPGAEALYGEVVERRHRQLAMAMGLTARLGPVPEPARSASFSVVHS
jgi:exopolyphosphatase / guanosine-5'-triphosphate,3'-diphosphate pyrophosphatase